MLGVILMGSVNGLWGDILERTTGKVDGNYTVHIVQKITNNCNFSYWIIANGCTFWNPDGTVKRIEVRQKTVNPNKSARNTEEFVFYHEIGHASICGIDEACADKYAASILNTMKIAK